MSSLISVVQNNLNTHTGAALDEAVAPAQARRILNKRDFRDTPKHGSWRNRVEVEIGVVRGQCLDQGIPDRPTVRRTVSGGNAAEMRPRRWSTGASPPPTRARN